MFRALSRFGLVFRGQYVFVRLLQDCEYSEEEKYFPFITCGIFSCFGESVRKLVSLFSDKICGRAKVVLVPPRRFFFLRVRF